jgi:hypothetical protein
MVLPIPSKIHRANRKLLFIYYFERFVMPRLCNAREENAPEGL